MIADGKHEAKLFDADFCVTNAGTPAISFVWETADGERTSYVMALTDSTGRPNHFVIQLTKRWAQGWDGCDLTWFRMNREALLGTSVVLTVREGKVEWVTPVALATGEVKRLGEGEQWNLSSGAASPLSGGHAGRRIHIDLIVDPAKLAEIPERIEPTFEEAKALFDFVTEGTDKLDADKVWTIMAKKIGPLQVDFGEEEWSMMIEKIKHLRSWSGVVSW